MTTEISENLPDEVLLALAHTQPELRDALRIFFELDLRLGRIVSATSEPMLGQMRLAWWRDMLGTPVEDRPGGDAVLDGIGEHWAGREAELVPLVDAWEHLLADPPLDDIDAIQFAENRAKALTAPFPRDVGDRAAWHWAMADLAANVSVEEEREMLVSLGMDRPQSPRLFDNMRGLAVLGALGLRALKRGGRPLMEGRTAALVALRAAIIGR